MYASTLTWQSVWQAPDPQGRSQATLVLVPMVSWWDAADGLHETSVKQAKEDIISHLGISDGDTVVTRKDVQRHSEFIRRDSLRQSSACPSPPHIKCCQAKWLSPWRCRLRYMNCVVWQRKRGFLLISQDRQESSTNTGSWSTELPCWGLGNDVAGLTSRSSTTGWTTCNAKQYYYTFVAQFLR